MSRGSRCAAISIPSTCASRTLLIRRRVRRAEPLHFRPLLCHGRACFLPGSPRRSCCSPARPRGAGEPEPVEFNRDIRPILSENCFFCHGQDPKHREADLRLDEPEEATRDLGGYAAVVPGKPGESELLTRLRSHDKDEVMPPPKSNRHVTPEQIALLERWIKEGARYQKHWAYLPPVKAPPAGSAGDGLGEASARPLCARAAGAGRARAVAGGQAGDVAAPGELRSHRAAADSAGARRLCRRGAGPRRGGVRGGGGPAAGLAALRRAPRDGLAGRGALRRYPRLQQRRPTQHVALAGLGDRRLQREPPVRPLHHRAARRRSAAGRDAGAAHRDRLFAQSRDQQRGRHHRRGVPRGVRRRSGADHEHGVARAHGGVRALPRSQIRPAQAARLLPLFRLLQQRARAWRGRARRQCGADDPRADARAAGGAGAAGTRVAALDASSRRRRSRWIRARGGSLPRRRRGAR